MEKQQTNNQTTKQQQCADGPVDLIQLLTMMAGRTQQQTGRDQQEVLLHSFQRCSVPSICTHPSITASMKKQRIGQRLLPQIRDGQSRPPSGATSSYTWTSLTIATHTHTHTRSPDEAAGGVFNRGSTKHLSTDGHLITERDREREGQREGERE